MAWEDLETEFPVLRYFAYDHLPVFLQTISKPFSQLAETVASRAMTDQMVDRSETSMALRKLLESKDAAVRAAV